MLVTLFSGIVFGVGVLALLLGKAIWEWRDSRKHQVALFRFNQFWLGKKNEVEIERRRLVHRGAASESSLLSILADNAFTVNGIDTNLEPKKIRVTIGGQASQKRQHEEELQFWKEELQFWREANMTDRRNKTKQHVTVETNQTKP